MEKQRALVSGGENAADVLEAQVRVLHARPYPKPITPKQFNRLRELDRLISRLTAKVNEASDRVEFYTKLGKGQKTVIDYWQKELNLACKQRGKLDKERMRLRLKRKGYKV